MSLTREQVVAAAIACVEADGPDALGVSRVARELGIKPPSLYNHVGKGDDLAWRVVIEGNRRLLGRLKDAVRGVADAREQLTALALATREWAGANPHLYALMSRVPPRNEDPEFRPQLVDMLDLFGQPLARLGQDRGEQLHAIRSLRAAIQGFLLLENSGQFALATDSGESFRWMVRTLLEGLSADRR